MLSDRVTDKFPPEPNKLKQARLHKYSTEWLGAEGAEYLAYEENGTWIIVVVVPVGHRALPTKWVYKYKFDDAGKLVRFKARLVICGNRQDNDFWRERYAAVARATTLKTLLAMVAALGLECDQADVVTAFLDGKLDEDEVIYIKLSDGRYAALSKAVYGLRRSPRTSAATSVPSPTTWGCRYAQRARCRAQHGVIHSQSRQGLRSRPSTRHNPIDVKALKLQLRRADDVCDHSSLQRYQSPIDRLLYPASQLRINISFAVGYLARAMANPNNEHYV
ncbi:hypothetical protein HBI56_221980 [Parastagonospora nodorum]|nr:hypothetical protein HBH56_232070 [Parastagonospora nodorum]QRD07756.1 hypothetical protein JI435_309650 [Parastagonospora nodorum SN15]KAH3921414.1 hypothetical protein HBH54_241010 [Parastagonospora nodorum]KAH3939910.1 hypothetical protein HBH53_225160 [Parastagonospora nodorum]KAH3956957.1 hypothetical protein HBH51_231790 [Parastagonospora nodorum]